jgi:hypothetical protein
MRIHIPSLARRTAAAFGVLALPLVALGAAPAHASAQPRPSASAGKPFQATAVAGRFNGTADGISLVGGALSTTPVATSNGDGTFSFTDAKAGVGTFGEMAKAPGVSVLSGDFNGDGRTDLALVGPAGWNTIPVAYSNGDGTYNVIQDYAPDFAGWAYWAYGAKPVVGDFNGDGKDDIALIGAGYFTTIPVAFSNGDGTFRVTNTSSPNFAAWGIGNGTVASVGDFNGDGKDDIVLTGAGYFTTIPVAFSNGDGTFTITNTSSPSFAGWAYWAYGAKPLIGDFNGDGKADIALTSAGYFTTIPVAFSNGDGTFTITNTSSPSFAGWATVSGAHAVAGDFNGDGKTDIALVGGQGWTSIPVAFSLGGGAFSVTAQSVPTLPQVASSPDAQPVLGDFNHDGRTDVAVVGAFGADGVFVALSNGDGTFTEKSSLSGAAVTFSREAQPALAAAGQSFPLISSSGCLTPADIEYANPANPSLGNSSVLVDNGDNGDCAHPTLFQLDSSGNVTTPDGSKWSIRFDEPNTGGADHFRLVSVSDSSQCLTAGQNDTVPFAEQQLTIDQNGNPEFVWVVVNVTYNHVAHGTTCNINTVADQDFWTH